MEQPRQYDAASGTDGQPTPGDLNGKAPPQAPAKPPRMLFLVRHGQSTFNVDGRHPGQLPGVPLTDQGRREAQQAAVALSALPLSAVISSPLARARETAEIIARGWALSVREDPRLMDTDVGAWAGRKIDEIARDDPNWKAFLEHPDEPPPGVERLSAVQARATAVVEEMRRDESLGPYMVLVAHADVVKLILGHYLQTSVASARYLSIGNAAISALAFPEEGQPHVLAINWTALPRWLTPPPVARAESPGSTLPAGPGEPGAEAAPDAPDTARSS